jgi:hypothetical protein
LYTSVVAWGTYLFFFKFDDVYHPIFGVMYLLFGILGMAGMIREEFYSKK